MNLERFTSYVRENGIRQSAVLTLDRFLKRQSREVTYEQWLSRNRPSSYDYRKMESAKFSHPPLIAVTAAMDKEDRIMFQQSLQMQIFRDFRALKNCPQADYILIVNGSVTLRPELLWECVSFLSDKEYSEVNLIYFDSDTIDEEGRKCLPAFRPDYDPELLEHVNYMGNVVLVRADLAYKAVIPAYSPNAFHLFLKRVCLGNAQSQEAVPGSRVCHIPKVLYHQMQTGPDTPAEQTYEDHSRDAESQPLISVLIPNKDHGEDLRRCVESLLSVNTWKNLEILILENNSEKEETFRLYSQLEERDCRIRILTWDKPFNYSAVNNYGALAAKGEYLLLLNNDTMILEPESIARMQILASRPQTGAVGALLLYPDRHVQHAGIILGYGGVAGHAWEGEEPDRIPSPFPWMIFSHTHNVSAVTGACMMLKRSVWQAAGGMDEQLKITFNDVDLCMKLRKEGMRILMCPDACLIHDESASRGSEDTPGKVERFHEEIRTFVHRWQVEMEKGDPFYNPNLTLTQKSWTCRDDLREARKPYVKYLHLQD